jgi:hypothetical protein
LHQLAETETRLRVGLRGRGDNSRRRNPAGGFPDPVLSKGTPATPELQNLLFTAPIWGFAGITVDFLYRGLAALLGDTASVPVVAAKICIDQFVYNVFFAAPYSVLAYHWKNSGFDVAALRRALTFSFYRDKIIPTCLPTGPSGFRSPR